MKQVRIKVWYTTVIIQPVVLVRFVVIVELIWVDTRYGVTLTPLREGIYHYRVPDPHGVRGTEIERNPDVWDFREH